jgi:hypothetical protein
MPGSRKWTGEELDALAALMEEADGEVTDWDALAAQLPNDPDYAIRSGRAAQTMSGREELWEVIKRRRRSSSGWRSQPEYRPDAERNPQRATAAAEKRKQQSPPPPPPDSPVLKRVRQAAVDAGAALFQAAAATLKAARLALQPTGLLSEQSRRRAWAQYFVDTLGAPHNDDGVWDERITGTISKICGIFTALVEVCTEAFRGTPYGEGAADNWMFYHDALSIMVCEQCREWMASIGVLKRWFLPQHGCNAGTRWAHSPTGNTSVIMQSAQWPSWRSMERWSGAPWRGCASREGDKPSSSTRTCSRGTSGAPRIYQGEVQEVERRINIHSFIVILRLLGIFHES